jgi:hypothetical protein
MNNHFIIITHKKHYIDTLSQRDWSSSCPPKSQNNNLTPETSTLPTEMIKLHLLILEVPIHHDVPYLLFYSVQCKTNDDFILIEGRASTASETSNSN